MSMKSEKEVGSLSALPPSAASPATSMPEKMGPVVVLLSMVVGAVLALVVMPLWMPSIARSMSGAEPRAYWYLSRASGLVAFVLLWASMASGVLISNKLARIWPGAYRAFDLHQYTSLLGLAFGTFHALVLLADRYIGYTLPQLLIPFAGADYRPFWVGLGQIAIYLSVVVSFTFYIRKRIGTHAWRTIHYISYAIFAITLLHGVESGTDSSSPWVLWMYWLAGASLLALGAYRGLQAWSSPAQPTTR